MSCPYKKSCYNQCLSPLNPSTNGGIKATSNGYSSNRCSTSNNYKECPFYAHNSSSKPSVRTVKTIKVKCPHCKKDIIVEL